FEREMRTGSDFALVQLDPRFERSAISRGTGPVEIRATTDQHLLATLSPSTNLPAFVAQWSADGRFIAVKRGERASDRPKNVEVTLEVWEAANGRRLLRLDDSAYEPVAFHPKRAQVLIARGDKHVLAWDLDAGREASEFT